VPREVAESSWQWAVGSGQWVSFARKSASATKGSWPYEIPDDLTLRLCGSAALREKKDSDTLICGSAREKESILLRAKMSCGE